MISESDLEKILRATVYDRDGDKVGGVGQVFLDEETGRPSWVTVKAGLFGRSESFVPYDDTAGVRDDRIDVAYAKDFILGAPRVDAEGHLDRAQERELDAYYAGGPAGVTEEESGDGVRLGDHEPLADHELHRGDRVADNRDRIMDEHEHIVEGKE